MAGITESAGGVPEGEEVYVFKRGKWDSKKGFFGANFLAKIMGLRRTPKQPLNEQVLVQDGDGKTRSIGAHTEVIKRSDLP